jgi:hypothetical protein
MRFARVENKSMINHLNATIHMRCAENNFNFNWLLGYTKCKYRRKLTSCDLMQSHEKRFSLLALSTNIRFLHGFVLIDLSHHHRFAFYFRRFQDK